MLFTEKELIERLEFIIEQWKIKPFKMHTKTNGVCVCACENFVGQKSTRLFKEKGAVIIIIIITIYHTIF